MTWLLSHNLDHGKVDQLCQNMWKDLPQQDAVEIIRQESWGTQVLAYPVNKQKRAIYVFFALKATPEALHEVERRLRIQENVLRFLSVRCDQSSTDASPLAVDLKETEEQKEIVE